MASHRPTGQSPCPQDRDGKGGGIPAALVWGMCACGHHSPGALVYAPLAIMRSVMMLMAV